jgi:phage-related protein
MANETTGRADLENCLQSLYPGEIITLIEIDGTKFGANIYRIHNENISYTAEELLQARETGSSAERDYIPWRGLRRAPVWNIWNQLHKQRKG